MENILIIMEDYVFPCCIKLWHLSFDTENDDNILNFSTINFNEDYKTELKDLFANTCKKWTNYPLGVINEFIKKGIKLGGLEFLYYGDVPNGAGLSSSASIEMVTAVALNELFGAGIWHTGDGKNESKG